MCANWACIAMRITIHKPAQLFLKNFSQSTHLNLYIFLVMNFVTSTGLSSSRRHLQGGASISGSLHGINSGSLMIPPAPLPPTSVPPPPHICIAGVDGLSAGILINDDDGLDDDDEIDLDNVQHEIFINDVRFDDEENHLEQMHHLENV
uniref:Uncharacterized protein n=1 Tax=Bactrocera dorsalis TaxID=27457 RepID=A0A034V6I0_BACDO